jgi:broad specificity phosphatase PhoE
MTKIYIVRHGEKEGREENSHLSDVGINQAEATAQYLKNRGISSIYSSPLIRAQDTAKIIAKTLSLPIILDPRLRERLVWGDREGETYKEFLEEWRKTCADRLYKPPVGDSSSNSGNRVKSLVDELAKDNSATALISHNGAIGDFLRTIFSDKLLPFSIEQATGVEMVNIPYCSVTTIDVNNGEYSFKKVGYTDHLQTK